MREGLNSCSSQNEVHTLNVSQGPAHPKTESTVPDPTWPTLSPGILGLYPEELSCFFRS